MLPNVALRRRAKIRAFALKSDRPDNQASNSEERRNVALQPSCILLDTVWQAAPSATSGQSLEPKAVGHNRAVPADCSRLNGLCPSAFAVCKVSHRGPPRQNDTPSAAEDRSTRFRSKSLGGPRCKPSSVNLGEKPSAGNGKRDQCQGGSRKPRRNRPRTIQSTVLRIQAT